MIIIISPAKKMKAEDDVLPYKQMPVFVKDAEIILNYLKSLNYNKLKQIWKCNDKIAALNFNRIKDMNLYGKLSPAIFAYEGIQYQYMAPGIFTYDELSYAEEHLRILSGLYGVLRPFDGVVPYRLEMQSKFNEWDYKTLYEFWKDKIAVEIQTKDKIILNLASDEYSKVISKYLASDVRFINCVFGEIIEGRIIEKGTLAKMARGEMVRFMAEYFIEGIEDIKKFDRLNYKFSDKLSEKNKLVFIRM